MNSLYLLKVVRNPYTVFVSSVETARKVIVGVNSTKLFGAFDNKNQNS